MLLQWDARWGYQPYGTENIGVKIVRMAFNLYCNGIPSIYNYEETDLEGQLQSYPAPDKEADPLAWAAHINTLMEMAEESVIEELIYN